MMANYHDGIGSGPAVLTNDLYVVGEASPPVFYVSSIDGDNGNEGTRLSPLATLVYAFTQLSGNACIIVLADGHTETITAEQTLWDHLFLVGEGGTAGEPSVELTYNAATGSLFTWTGGAQDVRIQNIKFKAALQAAGEPLLTIGGGTFAVRAELVDCYFEVGEEADEMIVEVAGDAGDGYLTLAGCYFVSVATVAAAPVQGLSVSGINELKMTGCVFDGGTKGFAGAAAEFEPTHMSVEQTSLLRGVRIDIAVATLGWFGIGTTTGDSFVNPV